MTTPLQQMRDEVEARQSRYWDDEQKRCAGKKVVLVEGDDDRDVLEALLAATDVAWPTRAAVVVAGSRARLMSRLLTTFPSAIGLIDRDVWTDQELAAETASLAPRLFATNGWCLENMFLVSRTAGESPALDQALEAVREEWIRAGAFWWTLQRTREAFNTWQEHVGWNYGSLKPDMNLESHAKLVASLDARIPKAVRRAAGLDLHQIGDAYVARLKEVKGWSPQDQWLRGVHGKSAFSAILVPWLNQGHAARNARSWLIHRASVLAAPPAPLDAILAAIL